MKFVALRQIVKIMWTYQKMVIWFYFLFECGLNSRASSNAAVEGHSDWALTEVKFSQENPNEISMKIAPISLAPVQRYYIEEHD